MGVSTFTEFYVGIACDDRLMMASKLVAAHVAGSIAGRRSTDGSNEQPGSGDGMARAAKLSFFDIGVSNKGLTVPLISTVLATGYNDAGARIHSASWGSPNQNSYSSFDHNADSFM